MAIARGQRIPVPPTAHTDRDLDADARPIDGWPADPADQRSGLDPAADAVEAISDRAVSVETPFGVNRRELLRQLAIAQPQQGGTAMQLQLQVIVVDAQQFELGVAVKPHDGRADAHLGMRRPVRTWEQSTGIARNTAVARDSKLPMAPAGTELETLTFMRQSKHHQVAVPTSTRGCSTALHLASRPVSHHHGLPDQGTPLRCSQNA